MFVFAFAVVFLRVLSSLPVLRSRCCWLHYFALLLLIHMCLCLQIAFALRHSDVADSLHEELLLLRWVRHPEFDPRMLLPFRLLSDNKESESDADTEAETDADTEAETQAKTEADAKKDTDAKTEEDRYRHAITEVTETVLDFDERITEGWTDYGLLKQELPNLKAKHKQIQQKRKQKDKGTQQEREMQLPLLMLAFRCAQPRLCVDTLLQAKADPAFPCKTGAVSDLARSTLRSCSCLCLSLFCHSNPTVQKCQNHYQTKRTNQRMQLEG